LAENIKISEIDQSLGKGSHDRSQSDSSLEFGKSINNDSEDKAGPTGFDKTNNPLA
jgi:hypothetical protein